MDIWIDTPYSHKLTRRDNDCCCCCRTSKSENANLDVNKSANDRWMKSGSARNVNAIRTKWTSMDDIGNCWHDARSHSIDGGRTTRMKAARWTRKSDDGPMRMN